MFAPGQKAKYSLRANYVCCGPDSGHEATTAACPGCARRRRELGRVDEIAAARSTYRISLPSLATTDISMVSRENSSFEKLFRHL